MINRRRAAFGARVRAGGGVGGGGAQSGCELGAARASAAHAEACGRDRRRRGGPQQRVQYGAISRNKSSKDAIRSDKARDFAAAHLDRSTAMTTAAARRAASCSGASSRPAGRNGRNTAQ